MARLLEREVNHVPALLLYAQLGVMDPKPTFCPFPPQLNIWHSLSRPYYTVDVLFNQNHGFLLLFPSYIDFIRPKANAHL